MDTLEKITEILFEKGCFGYDIQILFNSNLLDTEEEKTTKQPLIYKYAVYYHLPPKEGEPSNIETIAKRKRMASGETLDECLVALKNMENGT